MINGPVFVNKKTWEVKTMLDDLIIVKSCTEKVFPTEQSNRLIPGLLVTRNSHADDCIIKLIEENTAYKSRMINQDLYEFTTSNKALFSESKFLLELKDNYEPTHYLTIQQVNEAIACIIQ